MDYAIVLLLVINFLQNWMHWNERKYDQERIMHNQNRIIDKLNEDE